MKGKEKICFQNNLPCPSAAYCDHLCADMSLLTIPPGDLFIFLCNQLPTKKNESESP